MQFGLVASAALALAVAAGAATPVRAAEAQAGQTFKIMGPARCAAWPKSGDIASASKAVPLNWALGFLSGWAAQSNLALLDVIDPAEVSEWLTSYCQAHPSETLPMAVRELERDLEAKLPGPPEPPQATGPAPAQAAPAPAEEPKAAQPAKPKPARRAPARRRPR
jgi:hypothetical protein